jgi:hypothetical protein
MENYLCFWKYMVDSQFHCTYEYWFVSLKKKGIHAMVTRFVNMLKFFDGAEMRRRTCPYEGQSKRTRVVHDTGVVMTGTLTNRNHEVRAVTARFGRATKAFGFLTGWGITMENRSDPSLLSKEQLPSSSYEGDLLMLGEGERCNSIYTNDTNLITNSSLFMVTFVSFVIGVFKRTGLDPTFVRIPYSFFGVDRDTRFLMKNADPSPEPFDPSYPSRWNFHSAETDLIIGRLSLQPWDTITTGEDLVFKHDLVEQRKLFGINTVVGVALASILVFSKEVLRYMLPTTWAQTMVPAVLQWIDSLWWRVTV